jgi:L-asparaginase
MKNRVLVLFCGGTIIMKESKRGFAPPADANEAMDILNQLEPKIEEIANIDFEFVANMDSTNIDPGLWEKLSAIIYEKYDEYDGFVVTHGTDTMAYTASALSFALKDIGKPIILTGSQIPGTKLETDARLNYINAVRLATKDLSGVYIVFDERIIQGNRATKVSESELDAFKTVNADDAGKIRMDIKLNKNINRRHKRLPILSNKFDSDIAIITLAPGSDYSDLSFWLTEKRIKGLIIQAFGSGNLPNNFQEVFENAHKNRVPIVVKTQCLNGKTNIGLYGVGPKIKKSNIIQSYDMSLEATATKLMWTIYNIPYENTKMVMESNFAGEIDNSYI